MKRFFILITCACLFAAVQLPFSQAQTSEQWRHYLRHNYVRTMAASGDTLWIGYDYALEERVISTGSYRILYPSHSGLNSNYINSVRTDPSGNIWLSVGNRRNYEDDHALIRTDGINWTYSTVTDSGDLFYPMYFAIDSSGSVWVIGGNSRLYKFSGTNWTIYDPRSQNITFDKITSMAVAKSGSVWIGAGTKLVKFDGNGWKTIALPAGYDFTFDALASDSKNNLWAGTDNGGLLKFDGNLWTAYNTSNSPIPGNSINTMCIDKNDKLWMGLGKIYPEVPGTYYGLAEFDGSQWKFYNAGNSGLPSNNVTAVTGDAYGNIWVGTYDKSFAKFDGNKWTTYNSSNSPLPAANITEIDVDHKGIKWFSSEGGLSELQGNLWKVYIKDSSGLPADGVYSVAFDSAGNKWIATDSGLAKYDDNNWTVYNTHNSELPDNSISTIAVDKKGVKWMGGDFYFSETGHGLVSFDGKKWTAYNKDNSILPTNSIHTVKTDTKGNKWIVYKDYEETAPSFPLWQSGLFKYNDTAWVNYLDYAGLPIYALEFDRLGKLWAGGKGFGLTIFDGKEWIDFYRKNSAMPCDTVTAIAADSNGYVWIGTLRGLAVTNGTEWKVYNTLNSELRSNEINSLAVDDSNYLWIAAKDNFVSSLKLGEDVNTGFETIRALVIKDFSLSQNYPNPFNPATAISYYLPYQTNISLKVYDILGREVAALAEGMRPAGSHKIIFNAQALPSGVYIYRLQAGNFTASRKLLLIK